MQVGGRTVVVRIVRNYLLGVRVAGLRPDELVRVKERLEEVYEGRSERIDDPMSVETRGTFLEVAPLYQAMMPPTRRMELVKSVADVVEEIVHSVVSSGAAQ